jgi:uncharacterized protein (TIGR02646 family)
MIFFVRGDAPPGLQQKAVDLLVKFNAKRLADPKTTPSKFWGTVRKEIREEASVLATRAYFKCAFCESRANHVQHPHIEHYRPKGRIEFEHLMFSWGNWLLSCGRCNESKWKHFPDCGGVPCLLDPSTDDPTGHIAFYFSEVEGLTFRGWRSIQMLDLQRSPLIRERSSWLTRIDSLLLLATLAVDEGVKVQARRLLIWSMQVDAPYSAMTTQHLVRRCPKLAQPVVPHPHIEEDDAPAKMRALVQQHRALIAEIC